MHQEVGANGQTMGARGTWTGVVYQANDYWNRGQLDTDVNLSLGSNLFLENRKKIYFFVDTGKTYHVERFKI